MRIPSRTGGHLLDAVGVAMLVAGPAMLLRAGLGRRQIRRELAAQEISFPDDPPAGFARHAGRRVETGPQAHAFAEVIRSNLAGFTGGRTYAQLGAELAAVKESGGDGTALAELQRTAFTGEMLRASLMSAYQAWQVTTLAAGLGALFTGLGAGLVSHRDH